MKRLFSVISVILLSTAMGATAYASSAFKSAGQIVSGPVKFDSSDFSALGEAIEEKKYENYLIGIEKGKEEKYAKDYEEGFLAGADEALTAVRNTLDKNSASYAQGLADGAQNVQVVAGGTGSITLDDCWEAGSAQGFFCGGAYNQGYVTMPQTGWFKFSVGTISKVDTASGHSGSFSIHHYSIGTASGNTYYFHTFRTNCSPNSWIWVNKGEKLFIWGNRSAPDNGACYKATTTITWEMRY